MAVLVRIRHPLAIVVGLREVRAPRCVRVLEAREHELARVPDPLRRLQVFAIAVLDHRRGASMPVALAIAGDALVAFGLRIVACVFRANTFTSATVEVARDQEVVSTGPYAVVRHPMYAGALVMLAGIPLALASWWALVALPVMLLVIAWRLRDEERQLAAELRGYAEYRAHVKYRLVPFVW